MMKRGVREAEGLAGCCSVLKSTAAHRQERSRDEEEEEEEEGTEIAA